MSRTAEGFVTISDVTDGAQGPALVLTPSAQTFTFMDTVATPASQTITLTATKFNLVGTVLFSTSPAVSLSGTGDTRTMSLANFGSNKQVTVTASVTTAAGTVTDTIVIIRANESSALAGADRTSSVLGGTGVNHILPRYSSFDEAIDPPIAVSGGGTASFDATVAYLSLKSIKLVATATTLRCSFALDVNTYNTAILPNRKWIYSIFVRSDVASAGVIVLVRLQTGVYKSFSTVTSSTVGEWTRVSSLIDLSAESSTRIHARVGVTTIGATVWFDCPMIEPQIGESTVPSPFSKSPNFLVDYTGDLDATHGAPPGTLVNGVPVEDITEAVTNFNNSNDRDVSAVVAPTITAGGVALDHTLQNTVWADISFEWNWDTPANEGNIDGFIVLVRQSSASGKYTFGTNVAEETAYVVPANKRAFILYGVSSSLYYTFGVQAYRSVDKSLVASGVIKSAIVTPTAVDGEDPYRPTASTAYSGSVSGSVTGLVGGVPASALVSDVGESIAFIDDVCADGVFDIPEKLRWRLDWEGMQANYTAVRSAAVLLSVSVTALDTARNNLYDFLNNSPHFVFTTDPMDLVNSALDSALFKTRVTAHFTEMQLVIDKSADAYAAAARAVAIATSLSASFVANKDWRFRNTANGWTVAAAGTLTNQATFIRVTNVSGNAYFVSPVISIVGAQQTKVRAKIRRSAGTGAWKGRLYWKTAGHVYNSSYYHDVPNINTLSSWHVIEWNLTTPTVGGTDWTANTIIGIRLDCSAGAVGDVWEIEWVAIGEHGFADRTADQDIAALVNAGTTTIDGGKLTAGTSITSPNIYGGQLNLGNFVGYAWPASGGGAHFSGSGLLMGRYVTGAPGEQYVVINPDGSIFMPGFSVSGGNATFSGALAANTVTTNSINGGAVTDAYVTWLPAAIYPQAGFAVTTLASVTLTTIGNSVIIQFDTDWFTGGAYGNTDLKIYRDGILLKARDQINSHELPVFIADTPSAGVHTYTLTLSGAVYSYITNTVFSIASTKR